MPEGAVPIYALSDRAPRAVPTGRVLVRFENDLKFEDQRDGLAAAGFVAEEVLSYASHAGWVRATSASIADALAGLERLANLPNVRHVEPQLLYSREFK